MDETSKVSSKSEILAFRLTFVPCVEALLSARRALLCFCFFVIFLSLLCQLSESFVSIFRVFLSICYLSESFDAFSESFVTFLSLLFAILSLLSIFWVFCFRCCCCWTFSVQTLSNPHFLLLFLRALPLNKIKFPGVPLSSPEFPWVPLSSLEFPWVLWVLWVQMSFL